MLPSNPSDIPSAVAAAREADVVVLYIGGKAGWYSDDLTEGEGKDTANIDLPPQQVELVNAVADLGKPTVAVVSFGRPQGLAPVIDRLPALLTAYYGGPHQGVALADALFGVTNPGGKLPVTLPRHVGQVPIHHGQRWGSGYRRTEADIHKGYLDMPSTPLFPFGHGLSYTTFEYGPLGLRVPPRGHSRSPLPAGANFLAGTPDGSFYFDNQPDILDQFIINKGMTAAHTAPGHDTNPQTAGRGSIQVCLQATSCPQRFGLALRWPSRGGPP